MPARVSCSLNTFVFAPSADPMPRNSTFTFLLNAAASANTPPLDVFGSKAAPPPLLPLKPPI